jgi:large subunit ribosomal protein L1
MPHTSSYNPKSKITKLQGRSKKYAVNLAKIKEVTKAKPILSPSEAVELLFSLEQPAFKDGQSVELHAKLAIDSTKSDQLVRSSVVLPHGTGKKVIIAAFVSPENVEKAKKAGADIIGSEDLVEKIKNEGKINFDKAIAEPAMMKKLAAIARILGVAGVMPNPKTGTVGVNIEEIIKTIKAGKFDFKNDKSGNLHFSCGKINKQFTPAAIVENIEAILDAIEKAKPEGIKKKYILTIHLSSTISPSVRIR